MPTPDLEQLLRVVADEAGVPGEAVAVLTHREGRVVARTALPSGAGTVVKVSADAGHFAAEAAAIETLRAADLPVSRVRTVRTGPPSVIVLDWTPGRAVRPGDAAGVRRDVVGLLSRIHRLPASPPYGGANADLVTWIDGWCNHALDWWRQRDGTTEDDVRVAWSWYHRVRPLIAGRTGSMIIVDGVPDHFIVGPDDRVRLIDVAELQAGDPVMDLAVLSLAAPGIFNGVLDRYDQAEVDHRHLADLLPFYVFLRALAMAEWHLSTLHDDAGGATWLGRAAAELPRPANH